jgi:hypothetical protein
LYSFSLKNDSLPPCCSTKQYFQAPATMADSISYCRLPCCCCCCYCQIVTRDATAEAGAAPDCADNVREAFQLLFDLGSTETGRQQLQQAFLLCEPLTGEQQVTDLAYWVQASSSQLLLHVTAHECPTRC